MSLPTMTTQQANWLYVRGQAFFEGHYGMTTRTAGYYWVTPTPDHEGYYERITEGLRVQHSLGVRWDKDAKRFRRCHCDHCMRWPDLAASVDVVD